MRSRALILAVVLCCAFGPVLAARERAADWTDYENDRFGFSLRYPASVFEEEETAGRGGGVTFASRDGAARLIAGAFPNEEGYTVRSYRRYLARRSYPNTDVDYAPRGRTWFVLSGEREGTMYYEKVMFSCGGDVINSFALVYPVDERDFYDPIVERMEDTFRPGDRCQ